MELCVLKRTGFQPALERQGVEAGVLGSRGGCYSGEQFVLISEIRGYKNELDSRLRWNDRER